MAIMADMTITGKITHVLDKRGGTSARTGNAWCIQPYVLETNEQFPKHVCFEVFGDDKIEEFNIEEGHSYKVSIDIDAHEYQGRWYNQVRAWKVEPADAQAAPQATPEEVAKADAAFAEPTDPNKLPF